MLVLCCLGLSWAFIRLPFCPILGCLGFALELSRAVFGCIGYVLGSLGALLAPSWLSRLSWGTLAPSCASLGPYRNRPGRILGLSWAI